MMPETVRQVILGARAVAGDGEAARLYCGAYTLVQRTSDGELFRCAGDIPQGFTAAPHPAHPYDAEGLLLPRFWSLARVPA